MQFNAVQCSSRKGRKGGDAKDRKNGKLSALCDDLSGLCEKKMWVNAVHAKGAKEGTQRMGRMENLALFAMNLAVFARKECG